MVRVQRAGICGSDLHIYHGSNPFAVYPRVIGHEFAGTVEAVGDGVGNVAAGDHVVVDPVVSCGRCYACRAGRSNVCANLEVFGVHRDGGFRNHVVVPASNAVKVRSDLPISIAALAEPLSIAANVLSRTGIAADDTVLVYGAGTVGLTVVQVAKLHGARCIVADLDDKRLERAKEFGADVVLNSSRVSVPDAVRDENDGLGPTVVIDGAGVPALLEEACRLASPARTHRPAGLLPRSLQHQPAGDREEGADSGRLSPEPMPAAAGDRVAGERQAAAGGDDHPGLPDRRRGERLLPDRDRPVQHDQGAARLRKLIDGQRASISKQWRTGSAHNGGTPG
nr:alcohol dehydrogenase catalytic domain-containing protein [Azospirillum sp. INR13]